ncbi:MAG: hypothetical protein GY854_35425 [Deltaproteobacteria bacterium]|nr:hypothetical protein [Deltaproteobacteria bacterium]
MMESAKETSTVFIIAVFLVSTFHISDVKAAPDSTDEHEPFVGPETKHLPPLTAQELDSMSEESRVREWKRTPLKIMGISFAFHGGGSVAFGLSLIARAIASIDWGGHGDDDEEENDSSDVFEYSLIALPVISGAMIFPASAVATYIGNRVLWTRTRYLPVLLGGVIGWGLNTGLMFGLATTGSERAFLSVAIISTAVLPTMGEMLGYMASRTPVEVGPMRIKEPESRRQQSRLETQWIPPMPTLLPAPGQSYPTPGLLLGGARF